MNQAAAASIAATPPYRLPRLAGRTMSGLVIAFFVLDAAMKFPPLQPVTDTMAALGWSADSGTARALGVIMLIAIALYAYPPTAILGAILVTGYLGGAVATHARIGSPLFTHTLFGVYVGILAWGGLWLRSPALRAVLRTPDAKQRSTAASEEETQHGKRLYLA